MGAADARLPDWSHSVVDYWDLRAKIATTARWLAARADGTTASAGFVALLLMRLLTLIISSHKCGTSAIGRAVSELLVSPATDTGPKRFHQVVLPD